MPSDLVRRRRCRRRASEAVRKTEAAEGMTPSADSRGAGDGGRTQEPSVLQRRVSHHETRTAPPKLVSELTAVRMESCVECSRKRACQRPAGRPLVRLEGGS